MSEKEQEIKIKDRRHWVADSNGGDEETDDGKPSYVKQLEQKLEANDEKLKEYTSAYKSKMAENDQFRARLENDVERRVEIKTAELMRGILPVLDNLAMAGESARSADDPLKVAQGIGLIQSELTSLLGKFGMKELDCLGKEFDPAVAQAVSVENCDDRQQDGKVLAVIQKGYTMGELLIRPAMVKVGKAASNR